MDRKEFIEQVRRGGSKFRVDEIRISFPSAEVCGSGMLEVLDHRFWLYLRQPKDAVPPEMPHGVVTQKDFGALQGIIDNDLRFDPKNLPPHHHRSSHVGGSTLLYELDSCEFAPVVSHKQGYE